MHEIANGKSIKNAAMAANTYTPPGRVQGPRVKGY